MGMEESTPRKGREGTHPPLPTWLCKVALEWTWFLYQSGLCR